MITMSKKYTIIKELGKGAFSNVYKIVLTGENKDYAMKRVKTSQLNNREKANALNEVRILASIYHPNIIEYKEAFFEEETKSLNIIMEFADDGDLESKIQSHKKSHTKFKENEIFSIFIQLIQGLKVLHDIKIMHRDLKSANVFLTKNLEVKLGDLNVAKVIKMNFAYTQTGTPFYASPEVWSNKPYDYKSDIWSAGIILYEMCCLKPPFKGGNIKELFNSVLKGAYEPLPSCLSKDLCTLIKLLLQINPKNRPSCDKILFHPIIQKRINKKFISYHNSLLNTIRFPINLSELNSILPKKSYSSASTKKTNSTSVPERTEKKLITKNDSNEGDIESLTSNDEISNLSKQIKVVNQSVMNSLKKCQSSKIDLYKYIEKTKYENAQSKEYKYLNINGSNAQFNSQQIKSKSILKGIKESVRSYSALSKIKEKIGSNNKKVLVENGLSNVLNIKSKIQTENRSMSSSKLLDYKKNSKKITTNFNKFLTNKIEINPKENGNKETSSNLYIQSNLSTKHSRNIQNSSIKSSLSKQIKINIPKIS